MGLEEEECTPKGGRQTREEEKGQQVLVCSANNQDSNDPPPSPPSSPELQQILQQGEKEASFLTSSPTTPPSRSAVPSPPKMAADESFSQIMERADGFEQQLMENGDSCLAGGTGKKAKIITDAIHGSIEMPAFAVAVIDTPQFQRLREIKQTGNCHLVYPSATHDRFQHSVGVAHLARVFAEDLKRRQPRLGITRVDVNCVLLAGLCHDLGHGPYSHLWESFVKQARVQRAKDPSYQPEEYHHEDVSILMLDRMLSADGGAVREALRADGGIQEQDIVFIKELIVGPLDESGMPDRSSSSNDDSSRWPYRGRPVEKSFLYEIVANKTNGVDVDKWDYFLRDDYAMRIGHVFDYKRFIGFCRVSTTATDGEEEGESKGRRRICIRDKEAENLFEMYSDRTRLHKHGYQHRCVKILDRMLVDAWLLADRHLRFSDASLDRFERLTDAYVAFKIREDLERRRETSPDPSSDPAVADLSASVALLDRMTRRDLYRVVAEVPVVAGEKSKRIAGMGEEEMLDGLMRCVESGGYPISRGEVSVIRKRISLGIDPKKSKFFFFDHSDPGRLSRASGESVAARVPSAAGADVVMVCCTGSRKKDSEAASLQEEKELLLADAVEVWRREMEV